MTKRKELFQTLEQRCNVDGVEDMNPIYIGVRILGFRRVVTFGSILILLMLGGTCRMAEPI